MNAQRIRPLALCIFRRRDEILVFEGYDDVKDEVFYRLLGGGIHFGEHSSEAAKREMKEELGAEICNLSLLGTIENIFTYNGNLGHEIVQIYYAEFKDPTMYAKDVFEAYEDDGNPITVVWKSLDFFKARQAPLYPDGLLELLDLKNKRSQG